MENASKALIIAGAILLAILIISLGIMIYNQASGVVNNNAMSEVDITTFNQKFEQYVGDKVRGANVIALISAVKSNNEVNSGDESKQVKLKGKTESSEIGTGKTYKVSITNYENGLVSEITITENKNTPTENN